MLLVSKFFPEASVLPFLKLWSQCLVLGALFLSSAAFAVDIVVENNDRAKAPQLTQTDKGVPQIDIVKPQNGLSHNRFEQYNVGVPGVVINNSCLGENVAEVGLIDANKNLKNESAKVILFEVTGASRSELQGATTIAGDKANFILANPNGIICNGCSFINTHDVELRTDRLHSVVDGQINWERDLKGDIYIGKDGITARNGALVLSSGKIKIEGAVSAKDLLRAEAHFADTTNEKNEKSEKNEKYAIDVSASAPITAGKVYLIATGEGAGVKISAPKSQAIITNKEDINIEAKGPVDIAGGLYSANNLNIKAVDLNADAPIKADGDFKFIGRNFKNQNTFAARNINLGLSGDFVNEANGAITAKNMWSSANKGFTNNGKINVDKAFKVQGDYFVNDNGGSVSAGSTEIHLAGKREDGNSLYQRSNSILESREGGMELVAPDGGMYFGYKKEFTGDGDNKDGFRFVGSQLISRGGPIHIQSGGSVVFDGTQVSGDVVVEAKGEVKENKLEGSYKNGVRDVTTKENKVRTVMKSESYTAREVVSRTKECVNRGPFGMCFGYDWEDHWGNVVHTRTVPVLEIYVEETTTHETHFQGVALNTNFAGNKQIFANKGDLLFKEAAIQYEDLSATDNIDYLKFVSLSAPVAVQERAYKN
jgi:filamentous hemagglutinin family protein